MTGQRRGERRRRSTPEKLLLVKVVTLSLKCFLPQNTPSLHETRNTQFKLEKCGSGFLFHSDSPLNRLVVGADPVMSSQ